jgi:peptidoglycan hydrolase-like protein with peptidoglycan-binding domain
MTAATMARLSFAAGGAVLEVTGNAIHWGIARYMRAPLANTAILAMTTLTAMAGSNALYWQRHEHPAPLFAPVAGKQAVADLTPVIPATRKHTLQVVAPLPDEQTTGSVAPKAEASEVIGNAEVTEIQRKLHAMQLFDGAIDGLYGPRTARAIKAFEQRMGLKPKGELTLELLEAVRTATVVLPEAETKPVRAVEALPEVTLPKVELTPKAEAKPVTVESKPETTATEFKAVETTTTVKELAPLPTPAPLTEDLAATKPVAEAKAAAEQTIVHRELPETPQEAVDIAMKTAGEAIDTIIDGVQTVTMTKPGKQQPVQQYAAADATATASVAAEPEAVVTTASAESPHVGVPLDLEEAEASASAEDLAVLDTEAKPEDLMPAFSVTDPVIVAKVQRGLASLGFLHGPADGVAGEATAKAIRNFEVYYNYNVTGRISPELLDLLVENGASI